MFSKVKVDGFLCSSKTNSRNRPAGGIKTAQPGHTQRAAGNTAASAICSRQEGKFLHRVLAAVAPVVCWEIAGAKGSRNALLFISRVQSMRTVSSRCKSASLDATMLVLATFSNFSSS